MTSGSNIGVQFKEGIKLIIETIWICGRAKLNHFT